jgi:hypothetical protein
MVVAVLMMSERLEKRSGATLAVFTPPIFAGTTCVSWFCVSLPPPRGNASGRSLYRHFRSSWSIWDEDGCHQRSGDQTRLGGMAWLWHVPLVPIWASWPLSLTCCAPDASHDKILTLKKSQVNLSSGRFLKHQNTQNRVFLSCIVVIKIRGIDGKSS